MHLYEKLKKSMQDLNELSSENEKNATNEETAEAKQEENKLKLIKSPLILNTPAHDSRNFES